MRVYRDRNDWWVGYYRGANHHYVCLLPTLVIRWTRRAVQPAEKPEMTERFVHRYPGASCPLCGVTRDQWCVSGCTALDLGDYR
jgi:hypothetical protein